MSMFNGYPAIRIVYYRRNEEQTRRRRFAWIFIHSIHEILEDDIVWVLRTEHTRYFIEKDEGQRIIALLDAVREDGRSRDYRPEDHVKEDESEGGIVPEPALGEVWGQSVIRPEDITQTREDQRTEDYWRGFHEGLEAQDLNRVEAEQEQREFMTGEELRDAIAWQIENPPNPSTPIGVMNNRLHTITPQALEDFARRYPTIYADIQAREARLVQNIEEVNRVEARQEPESYDEFGL